MIRLIIDILFPPACLSCRLQGTVLCDSCLHHARKSIASPYSFIVPLFDYKDPIIRKAIRAMKYFGRKDMAAPLAGELSKAIKTLPGYESFILVPIPMPSMRRRFRGYNQSELLARHIASRCGIALDTSLLVRKRTPKRQVESKGRRERAENQKGTFASSNVSGKRLILIDDVTTTGATLLEARKTLLLGHAAHVVAFAVAH